MHFLDASDAPRSDRSEKHASKMIIRKPFIQRLMRTNKVTADKREILNMRTKYCGQKMADKRLPTKKPIEICLPCIEVVNNKNLGE